MYFPSMLTCSCKSQIRRIYAGSREARWSTC